HSGIPGTQWEASPSGLLTDEEQKQEWILPLKVPATLDWRPSLQDVKLGKSDHAPRMESYEEDSECLGENSKKPGREICDFSFFKVTKFFLDYAFVPLPDVAIDFRLFIITGYYLFIHLYGKSMCGFGLVTIHFTHLALSNPQSINCLML
ncbi:RIKEN cDNA A630023P12, isoform CRA_a, partial [Mus musculus]